MRDYTRAILGLVMLVASCMACQAAPETGEPAPTVTPIPDRETGKLTPIPGFEEILTYGGGGEEPVLCSDYPSEPGGILVEGPEGDHAALCIHLGDVQTAAPVRVSLEQAGGSGIVLQSGELVLDRDHNRVDWTGFRGAGNVDDWTPGGGVLFQLSIWWPGTLPEGDWTVTVTQPGEPSATGEFQVSRPEGFAYIQALDEYSERELIPARADNGSQSLRIPQGGRLTISGGGFPAEVPVSIALYELRESEYFLLRTATVSSDGAGAVRSELEGPFDAGGRYILFGVMAPGGLANDLASFECLDFLGYRGSSACDDFQILPTASPSEESTQPP